MKPVRPARMLRAGVILFLVALTGGVVPAPAQAAAFRFWGYFQLANGAWAFARTGPGQSVPADGSVEGWRFAVADVSSTRTPRATPAFTALCAGTRVTAGTKRVGLVIDYGRPADSADGAAPPAAWARCVAVPVKATGSDVLVAGGAKLRADLSKGLTCAIDGWPAAGCGENVDPVPVPAAGPDTAISIAAPKASAAAVPAASQSSSSASSPGLVLGALLAVVLIGALGFAAWHRGRDASEH